MKLLLSFLEAKSLLQPYFPGDFQICQNVRQGQHGCFASDGERFVITREGLIDVGKITKAFQFNKNDIASLKNSSFYTTILLKNEIVGLTNSRKQKDLFIMICIILTCGLALPMLFFRTMMLRNCLKIVIVRPLLGSFENTPHNYKKDFDEFINGAQF